jgi:RNA polymerase sigma-70 factor (ECF subfamily)
MERTEAAEHRMTRMFSEHADAVHAYAVTRAGPDLAPDVVAETFLVAWRRLGVVPAEPLPWLLATARRVASTQHRARRRQDDLCERLAALRSIEPELLSGVEADDELWRAMDRIAEPERDALLLVAWYGLSYAEAAEVQRCARGAFAVRLHRGRRHLRALLGEGAGQLGGPAPTRYAETGDEENRP